MEEHTLQKKVFSYSMTILVEFHPKHNTRVVVCCRFAHFFVSIPKHFCPQRIIFKFYVDFKLYSISIIYLYWAVFNDLWRPKKFEDAYKYGGVEYELPDNDKEGWSIEFEFDEPEDLWDLEAAFDNATQAMRDAWMN